MREIVTLQLGELGNYMGNQFWNAQESYFTYDKNDVSLVNHDIHWRQGLAPDGSETFLPRAVIYDFKKSLGTLRKISPLYETEDEASSSANTKELAAALWNGKAEIHAQDPLSVSNYQEALNAGLTPTRPTAKDVRYWSDTTRVYFHPRSLVPLDDVEITTPKVTAGHWMRGSDLFRELDREHDLMDRDMRPFVEECDLMQGIQVMCSIDDIWAPFATEYVERMRDEYGKSCIVVWGGQSPDLPATKDQRLLRLETKTRAIAEMWSQASLLVPLSAPILPMKNGYTPDLSSFWHLSSLFGTALESAALASRLSYPKHEIGVSLGDMVEALNAHGKQTIARLRMTVTKLESPRVEEAEQRQKEKIQGVSQELRPKDPADRGCSGYQAERQEDEGEDDEMPDLDLDLFDLLGENSGRMRKRNSRSDPTFYTQILSRRGAARSDLPPKRSGDQSYASSRPREYLGRSIQHSYGIELGFPLLDSFPDIYSKGHQGEVKYLDVDTILSTDNTICDEIRLLKKAALFTVGQEDREGLGNSLSEIVDEYHEGWSSGSDDDDD
ncbi:mtDNA inheritance, partitioning of the mitochondrial organelle [Ceratocystis pirilliformis]|uniref:MtDNA inheritance, partitioning of the mitochondrial organelle n=1 Tax=Ceratocystis pirilliformis TaxID=259994 RepID=A0ABR3YHT3_9PEZI